MTSIFFFILICYGISNILIYGSIFEWLRVLMYKISGDGNYSLYKLFTCMMCLPTWVGFGLSFLLQMNGVETPSMIYGDGNIYLTMFFDGVLASGGVYAFNTLVEYFEGDDE